MTGDLGDTARRAAHGAGNERRLPRLLGHRLHRGRPPPRHAATTSRASSSRAHALGPEGDPRRGRQPHGRRDRLQRRRGAGAPYVEQATKPYRDTDGKAFDPAPPQARDEFPDLYPDERSFPYRPVVAEEDDATSSSRSGSTTSATTTTAATRAFNGESNTYGDFYGLDDLFTERPEVVQGEIDLWSQLDPRLPAGRVPARHRPARQPRVLARLPPGRRERRPRCRRRGLQHLRRGVRPGRDRLHRAPPGHARACSTSRSPSTAVPYAAGIGAASDLAGLFDQDDQYTTASVVGVRPGDLPRQPRHRPRRLHAAPRRGRNAPEGSSRRPPRPRPALPPPRGAGRLLRRRGRDDGRGEGNDKEARQDMFPTRVAAWRTQPRIGGAPVGAKVVVRPRQSGRAEDRSALRPRGDGTRRSATGRRSPASRVAAAQRGVFAVSRIDRPPPGRVRRRLQQRGDGAYGARADVLVPANELRDALAVAAARGATSDAAGLLRVTVPRPRRRRAARDPRAAPRPGPRGDARTSRLRRDGRRCSASGRASPARTRQPSRSPSGRAGRRGGCGSEPTTPGRSGSCSSPAGSRQAGRSRSSRSRAARRARHRLLAADARAPVGGFSAPPGLGYDPPGDAVTAPCRARRRRSRRGGRRGTSRQRRRTASSCAAVRAAARDATAEQVTVLFIRAGALNLQPGCAYDLVTSRVRKGHTGGSFAAGTAPMCATGPGRPGAVLAELYPRVRLPDQVGSWVTLDGPDGPPHATRS